MDTESKKSTRQHPSRATQDKATPRGGRRRGRGRGKSLATSRGPDCRNPVAKWTNGFRFPDATATDAQSRELRKIIVDYLRRMSLHRFSGFGTETLAEAVGLAERRTADLVKEVSQPRRDETVEMAKTVLQSMLAGRIAGVLGNKPTKDTRELFKLISVVAEREVDQPSANAFRMLKAAFDVDYLIWIRERSEWPFKSDGQPRRKR
jgi:hypothetical protein